MSTSTSTRTTTRTTTRTIQRIAFAALLLAAAIAAVTRLGAPEAQQQPRLITGAQPVTGTGSCDVTGVSVAYTTAWQATPAPAKHVVTTATVDAIQQPPCNGATLKVVLRQGTTDLGSSIATIGTGTTKTVTFSPGIAAAPVDTVFVELAGGDTPIPPECEHIKLNTIILGTTGNDTIVDTKGANLIYMLTGTDTVKADGKADCVVNIDGGDNITTSNGADVVLLTGDGNVVHAGNGADTIYVGNGNNNVVDGGNGNKNVCHVPFPVSEVAAHGDVITNCKVVHP